MTLIPFQPTMGATVTVSASGATARKLLGGQPTNAGSRFQVRIVNPGTTLAYIRFGDDTVVATSGDVPVLPGTAVIFTVTVPENGVDGTAGAYIAVILASGTATISITTGVGIS